MESVIRKIKGLDIPIPGISSPSELLGYVRVDLALAESEHFRATGRAHALGRRLAIFHCYGLGVFNLPLGTAFDTIGLHQVNLLLRLLVLTINQSPLKCQ